MYPLWRDLPRGRQGLRGLSCGGSRVRLGWVPYNMKGQDAAWWTWKAWGDPWKSSNAPEAGEVVHFSEGPIDFLGDLEHGRRRMPRFMRVVRDGEEPQFFRLEPVWPLSP